MATATLLVPCTSGMTQAKPSLALPQGALSNAHGYPGSLPRLSPTSNPLCTPQNMSSTWRTTVCPLAPERQGLRRQVSSLETTPTSSPVAGGPITRMLTFPDQSPVGVLIGAELFSRPSTRPISRTVTMDLTPITVEASPMSDFGDFPARSRTTSSASIGSIGLNTGFYEATPKSAAGDFPIRKTSSASTASIGLNTGFALSPTASFGTASFASVAGESSKGLSAFFVPMSDNGPAMCLRNLGA